MTETSYIDEAEKSVNRCRKVSSGDIIMPDDINCLVDTANNTVNSLREILNEIISRVYILNPADYILSKYRNYHYDKAGVFAWFDDSGFANGMVVLDGADADSVEINMNFVDGDRCTSGREFIFTTILGKSTTKYMYLFTTQDTINIKFSNPDAVMLIKDYYRVKTDAGDDEYVLVEDAITVKFKKGDTVVKKYDIDVLGMKCGDYRCFNWRRGYPDAISSVLFTPVIPNRWHFIEVGQHDYGGGGKLCLTAYDSTDILNANILASRCEYGTSVHLFFPPSTAMVALSSISIANLSYYYPFYISHAVFPYPHFKPTRTGYIYC